MHIYATTLECTMYWIGITVKATNEKKKRKKKERKRNRELTEIGMIAIQK